MFDKTVDHVIIVLRMAQRATTGGQRQTGGHGALTLWFNVKPFSVKPILKNGLMLNGISQNGLILNYLLDNGLTLNHLHTGRCMAADSAQGTAGAPRNSSTISMTYTEEYP